MKLAFKIQRGATSSQHARSGLKLVARVHLPHVCIVLLDPYMLDRQAQQPWQEMLSAGIAIAILSPVEQSCIMLHAYVSQCEHNLLLDAGCSQ